MAVMDRIEHRIPLSEGVSASVADDGVLSVNGPNGALTRGFVDRTIGVSIDGGEIVVAADLPRRKQKALAGTWAAHIRNMVMGVTDGFTYKLKAVYSHFPMNIKVESDKMTVSNYFGERVPRVADFLWPNDVKVRMEGKQDIIVSGVDKEKVGQTAAIIERTCTVRRRDRRVFQDGIYIVEKA